MKPKQTQIQIGNRRPQSLVRFVHSLTLLFISAAVAVTTGCGTAKQKEKNKEFFTSGSREADQRASQRMAKAEQLTGSGEGAGEKNVKKAEKVKDDKIDEASGAQAKDKLSLFDRLGGEPGISKITDDFLTRAVKDPRVNWERKGVKQGGFSIHHNKPVSWSATSENVGSLKKHLAQFFALATGGPARYDGKDVKSSHAALHITNSEFDAAVGDLKASLDKLQLPNREQKELLAIVESTRPQIVTER